MRYKPASHAGPGPALRLVGRRARGAPALTAEAPATARQTERRGSGRRGRRCDAAAGLEGARPRRRAAQAECARLRSRAERPRAAGASGDRRDDRRDDRVGRNGPALCAAPAVAAAAAAARRERRRQLAQGSRRHHRARSGAGRQLAQARERLLLPREPQPRREHRPRGHRARDAGDSLPRGGRARAAGVSRGVEGLEPVRRSHVGAHVPVRGGGGFTSHCM